MSVPPLPPKPQLPPQIRGLMPADTTGYSPLLPIEYRLELATRMSFAIQRKLQTEGILTGREVGPTGVDLRIKHGDDQKRKLLATMLADTLKRELTELGFLVTSNTHRKSTEIHIDINVGTADIGAGQQ